MVTLSGHSQRRERGTHVPKLCWEQSTAFVTTALEQANVRRGQLQLHSSAAGS